MKPPTHKQGTALEGSVEELLGAGMCVCVWGGGGGGGGGGELKPGLLARNFTFHYENMLI